MKEKVLKLVGIWLLTFALAGCGVSREASNQEPENETVSVEGTATAKPDEGVDEKQETKTDVAIAIETKEDKESPIAKLVYDLTKEELVVFHEQKDLCQHAIEANQSYEEVEAAVEKLYDIALGIQDEITVAEILYYCHMNDAMAMKDYLEGTEQLSQLILDYNDLLLKMYEGDNAEYYRFFEDWSEVQIKLLTCPSETSMALEVRNAEILTELYSMDEEEAEAGVGVLYSEFIGNNNIIAKEYDYTNYYDYASEAVYMRDYGAEERKQFRNYVKQYIVPIYNVVATKYEEVLQDLSLSQADKLMEILFYEYEELSQDYLKQYLEFLPDSVRDGMLHMFEQNNYIMADAEDAYMGAFTANIGDPFCFFGTDSQTSFVIIHELGHYYADLCMEEELMSFDLAETHSQGNEMLFLSYLKQELPEKLYEALLYYQLYNFTNVVIQSTMFDEFEEYIYNLEDVGDYTTEDYDRIMYEIVESYSVDDPYYIIPEGMLWLWKNVGIESPVYYLSYAVSAMAALNLYEQSIGNYEGAVEAYRKLQEEVTAESGFMGALEHAGVKGVFEEEAYIGLLGILQQ